MATDRRERRSSRRSARSRRRTTSSAQLVDAGVDAFRLNFSHGTHDDHAAGARVVREVQEETGKPLALIADLQGPKLRIGDLDAPRMLLKDELV